MSDNDNHDDERSAKDELKVGLGHLVSAAKKTLKAAEPLATRAAEEVGSTIEKLNKGGEQVASEVGKEVATLAGKLADKLRAVAERAEPHEPHEPPGPGSTPGDSSQGGGI
jgi:hypothetical protein